jgi:glycosyltransferase involved in cell wall biosynthesis
VHHRTHRGLAEARNFGLDAATGRYVAIADADDVYPPHRLAEEVAFMEAHADVGVCGGAAELFGRVTGVRRFPDDDARIRALMLFEPALVDPSTMMRRDVLARAGLRYDPSFEIAADYDLWVRAAGCTRFANLPRVLVRYRQHDGQLTARRRLMRGETDRVRVAQLRRLGIAPTEGELALHGRLAGWDTEFARADVEDAERWLARLRAANAATGACPEPAFSRILGLRWFWVCTNSTRFGAWSRRRFWASPLAEAAAVSVDRRVRFALKCWLQPARMRASAVSG